MNWSASSFVFLQLTVMKESRQVVESIKKAYSIKDSNQKVDFSELVIVEEVLRNVSLEDVDEEADSWDALDSSEEEEEETIDETSDWDLCHFVIQIKFRLMP